MLYRFIFLFIFSLLAHATHANDTIISEISYYLQKMKTAEGKFVQVNPDGLFTKGVFALKRPGKIYFDYDKPTPLRIISDGFWVAVIDEKLKTMERYPLSETPLKILLEEKPNFNNKDYKVQFEEKKGSYVIHAQDKESPEYGHVSLVFAKKPIALRQWIVIDAQGLETIVTLHDIQMNAPVKNKYFYIDSGIKK